MGNICIDLSLSNIFFAYFNFKKGKRKTKELECFDYYLEYNLFKLYNDLNNNKYKHKGYQKFELIDNKRRDIRVASIRDRLVHHIVYGYLNKIYDKTFVYDLWSCRQERGVLGAIKRTQYFLEKHPHSFIWRADIKKFFANIDHNILLELIYLKVKDNKVISIIKEIINSYSVVDNKGIPIGNLTSQIFANIYLNELDRFIKYNIKPLEYLRYGDDFIIITKKYTQLKEYKIKVIKFLEKDLKLIINKRIMY